MGIGIRTPLRAGIRINIDWSLIEEVSAAGDVDNAYVPDGIDIHEARHNVGMVQKIVQVKGRARA